MADKDFTVTVGGQDYDVTAPDERTAWKWANATHLKAIAKEGAGRTPPPRFVPSGEKPENPLLSGGPVNAGAIFAGRGLDEAYQGTKQMLGVDSHTQEKTVEGAQYNKDFEAAGGGFDPGRLAGNLIGTSPTMAMPGGAAKELWKRTLSSGGAGAAAGGAMFTPEGEDKMDQALTGAGIGAAIPPAFALSGKAAGMGYHGLIEPLSRGGKDAIKNRFWLEAAGDKSDEIIELLTKNKQLTPGSMPTAAEAASPAGRTEFSAAGASAARAKPSEHYAREGQQNAARIAAIDEFAGTPAKRAVATTARDMRAAPHYTAGEAQAADTSGLSTLMERPSSKAVLTRAERGMAERDKDFAPLFPNGLPRQMTGEEAQRLKIAFDDMIKLQPKSAADTAELKDIIATRGAFIDWMQKAFPSLGTARKIYKMTSGPINEMDVGTELRDKLVPALREEGKQKAGVFAGAIRDSAAILKDGTNQARFKGLEDVLTRRSLQTTHGVQDDLARADRNAEMARRGAQAGPNALTLATGNLERETGGKIPNPLNRTVMLANAIIARLGGKLDKRLAAEVALDALDPPTVAKALNTAKAAAARNRRIAEVVREMQQPLAVGAATTMLQGAQ